MFSSRFGAMQGAQVSMGEESREVGAQFTKPGLMQSLESLSRGEGGEMSLMTFTTAR